jgi:hypothetical protein
MGAPANQPPIRAKPEDQGFSKDSGIKSQNKKQGFARIVFMLAG